MNFLLELLLLILNMSITSSLIILVILIIRLPLKKAPKVFSYLLWGVALIKLIIPISFESNIGLLPNTQYIPTNIVNSGQGISNTTLPVVNDFINNNLSDENLLENILLVATVIWAFGFAFMTINSVIQYLKLKRILVSAVRVGDNIYKADRIKSPFVLGLFKGKIYLPSDLPEAEQNFIIRHEQHHLKRFDHITRIIAFFALSVHWFNPLVWFAFILSGNDMELSCDEAVLKTSGNDIRTTYVSALLRLSSGRKLTFSTPLTFGEGNTKERVKNIMKYKKPLIWVSVVAVIAVIIVSVVLITTQTPEIGENSSNLFEQIASTENNEIVPKAFQYQMTIAQVSEQLGISLDNFEQNGTSARLVNSFALEGISENIIEIMNFENDELVSISYAISVEEAEFGTVTSTLKQQAESAMPELSSGSLDMIANAENQVIWNDANGNSFTISFPEVAEGEPLAIVLDLYSGKLETKTGLG